MSKNTLLVIGADDNELKHRALIALLNIFDANVIVIQEGIDADIAVKDDLQPGKTALVCTMGVKHEEYQKLLQKDENGEFIGVTHILDGTLTGLFEKLFIGKTVPFMVRVIDGDGITGTFEDKLKDAQFYMEKLFPVNSTENLIKLMDLMDPNGKLRGFNTSGASGSQDIIATFKKFADQGKELKAAEGEKVSFYKGKSYDAEKLLLDHQDEIGMIEKGSLINRWATAKKAVTLDLLIPVEGHEYNDTTPLILFVKPKESIKSEFLVQFPFGTFKLQSDIPMTANENMPSHDRLTLILLPGYAPVVVTLKVGAIEVLVSPPVVE